MLPPVRATLSSFVEYQNPQQQPLLRQTINAAATANSTTNASMPISGGRLDILSLSAQLQLAQGFSIFAETIGKLLKLPRREGEALLDYARRLMEAVKALSPAQQASLERMLNQLVKGISLRLLTEVLNNPTGPDAARLAVRLETAQLLERDLAAKAVVSSYRQNGGVEPAPAAPFPAAQPQRPAEAAPANTAAGATTAGPKSESTTAPQTDTAPQTEPEPNPAAAEGEQDAPPVQPVAANAEPAEVKLQAQTASASGQASSQAVPADPALVEGQLVQTTEQETIVATVIAGASTEEALVTELAETETAEVFAPVLDDLPEDRASRTSINDADVWGPASNLRSDSRAPATGFYDGPALARLSQRGFEEQPIRQQANTARMGMPAMTEWLAEVFSEGNTDLLQPLPAAAKVAPEQQVLEELFDKDALLKAKTPLEDQNRAILQTPRAYASEEPEAPLPQAKPGSASPNGNGQPANITDTAEQLVLPIPLPIIPREGVALPYVAYPPEDRERDPEDRKAKAVTPTDEDGEQQHGGNEQQFAEDRSREDEAEEEKDGASGEQAEDGGRANDLYWRMAGWN